MATWNESNQNVSDKKRGNKCTCGAGNIFPNFQPLYISLLRECVHSVRI